MKMRKLLALVLCLCLILPLCSAAFATGNEGEQNTDPTATPVADAENPPVETPVPPAVDDPEPDACTCGAEEGAAHAADCPLNNAPGAASPTPAVDPAEPTPAADPADPTQSADPADPTPAASCTCDATDEEKAAEGFLHAEGCPLYVDTTAEDAQAFYDAVMACSSIEEVDAVMAKTGDGQSKKLYEALSDEARAAMNAHIEKLHQAYLESLVIEVEVPARNYSNVASFRELLEAMQVRPMLFRAARAAETSNTPEGLELSKTATLNADGSYTIQLEAYTTGEITASTGVKPVDIVLLVDMSTSMEDNFSNSGYVYTEVYSTDKGNAYYVKTGNNNIEVTWCDTCRTWTSGCRDFFGYHIEGTAYTPKTSAEDTTPGSVQFYTREYVQGMTRLEALQQAANAFIADVAEKGGNRMAIVGFHDSAVSLTSGFLDATEQEAALHSAINGIRTRDLEPATDHNDGLEAAEALFRNSDATAEERQRVVVLFTDGEPEPLNEGDWSSTTVKEAIESSYRLKNDYSAAVYCISVAPGTDASSMSTPMDRYMSYLSSNYPNARYTGVDPVKREWWDDELVYEQRVVNQITPGAQADISDGSFYLSASSMSTLQSIFKQIASQTGGSSISLGGGAVIRDIVTPYFDLRENASDVTVQTVDCLNYDTETGEATWSTTGTALENAVTIGESLIDVTGFDFDRNFVSEIGRTEGDVTQAGTFHGRKLVITFTVAPKAGFLGGNNVPTNDSESGVYDKDKNLVGSFVVPTVDVPLATVEVKAADKDVYLLGTLTGDALLSGAEVKATKDGETYTIDMSRAADTKMPYGLEPWQTEYVSFDLTANPEAGYTRLTDDKSFTLTATIEPTAPGTLTGNSANDTGDVRVYKPELTAADSTIYLGETADYAVNFDKATGIAWKHGVTVADTAKMGEAPALTVSYNPAAGAFTQDTDVVMTTAIGGSDVTQYTTFVNETDGHENNGAGAHQFTVFVKTCSLTVTKAGSGSMTNGTETHIFTVQGPNGISLKVAVQGNGSRTITGLPVGEYTVTEDTNWSWRYEDGKTGNATLEASEAGAHKTVTITNTNPTTKWLSGDSAAINKFAAQPASSAPAQQADAPAALPEGPVELSIKE